jgi:hypothetical protein
VAFDVPDDAGASENACSALVFGILKYMEMVLNHHERE